MKSLRWVFLVAIAFACSEDVQKPKSGYFTLTQLKSPKGGRAGSSSETPVAFNLGNLKASREFFFLLGNGGDNAITDITLETDNEAFLVSPNEISTLDGINSGSSSIIPLISLGVVHGTQLNGIGTTDLLEMGSHEGVLTISGKTIENGSTIVVSSQYKFALNAKIMDIILLEGETEIDLTIPQSTASGVPNVGGIGAVSGYQTMSGKFKIKNTGNVDINVTVRSLIGTEFTEHTITPNNTFEFLIPEVPGAPEQKFGVVSLDGNGTVVNPLKIQLGTDGKGYFIVNN